MARGFTEEDDALLEELGVEVEPERKSSRTAREERIIFRAVDGFLRVFVGVDV